MNNSKYGYGSHFLASFDVQVDGNHRWDEDKICEIDVYPQSLNTDGFYVTDTNEALASMRVPTGDYSDDKWYASADPESVKALPEHLREAFEMAVAFATAKQAEGLTVQHKWAVDDTVWVKEHIMPATVRELTVNGGYIVDMGDSGELDDFAPDELEDFDRERYER